jgi:hypothetical protein
LPDRRPDCLDALPASLEAGSTVRVLAPGDLLFRQGDPAAAIYKVESGRIRLIRPTVDDHLVILHTARRGELFAEASVFADAYHCDAIAAKQSRVRVYPKEIVMEALRTDAALAEALMARLARQLQECGHGWNCAASAPREIAGCCTCGFVLRSIAIEGQLQDIAAEIGMTREALYRALAALETEGHLIRNEITILLKKSSGV